MSDMKKLRFQAIVLIGVSLLIAGCTSLDTHEKKQVEAVDWHNKALQEATSSQPNWDLVIKWNKKAIKLNPDLAGSLGAYYRLGIAYSEKGMYDEAIRSLKKAVDLAPDDAPPHYNLGVVYARKGQHDKAIKSLKKAIELNPGFAEAYSGLGDAYALTGQPNKAIESSKKAIELNPDLAQAYSSLGSGYKTGLGNRSQQPRVGLSVKRTA
jgi:tetratricopeptide (TPR) repeat protein